MPFSPKVGYGEPPASIGEDASEAIKKPKLSEEARLARKAAKAARKAERSQLVHESPDIKEAAVASKDAKVVEVPAISITTEEAKEERLARKAAKAARKAERSRIERDSLDVKEAKVASKDMKQIAPQMASCPHLLFAEPVVSTPPSQRVVKEKEVGADVAADGCTQEGRSSKKSSTKRKAKALASSADVNSVDEVKRQRGDNGEAVQRPSDTSALGAEAFRKAHEILITGSACPAPFESFDEAEAQIGKPLGAALRAQGYSAPTPIQAQAWPIALQGKDLVAVAKTGSGKTCGFLLPALARIQQRGSAPAPSYSDPCRPTVLVIAPTRELVQQIAVEAEKFATAAKAWVVALYGGVPKGEQVGELKRGADVVVATPGRLIDFSKGNAEKGFAPLISFQKVTYLVLDEADRMLDMGFEPDIRKIVADCPPTGEPEQGGGAGGAVANTRRQTLFFTATWPREVQKTASFFTSQNATQLRIGQGAGGDKLTANKNVTQIVSVVEEHEKFGRLQKILEKELAAGESAIVFAMRKSTCDYLEQKLWDSKEELSIGTWVRAIHSGKEQWDRDGNLATFRGITTGKDNGRRGILVATDVAARGLDIPGVSLVIVYDFGGGGLGQDSGVESYVHRIGRTGRAGKTGKAYTFFGWRDCGASKLVQLLDGAKQKVTDDLRALADKEAEKRNWKAAKNSWWGSKGGHGGSGGKGKGGKGGKGHGEKGKGFGKGGKGKGGKGKGWR